MFAQNLWGRSTARIKRKAQDSIKYSGRRDGGSKARKNLFEEENSIQNIAAGEVCSSRKSKKEKVPWSREIACGGSIDIITAQTNSLKEG